MQVEYYVHNHLRIRLITLLSITTYGVDRTMKIVCYVDSGHTDIIKTIESIRRIEGIRDMKFKYKGE